MSFTGYKVKLPATAGKTIKIGASGMSVVVEKCPLYLTPDDVPKMQFDSGNSLQNIYPKSVYSVQQCDVPFRELTFTATSASVNDEIYVQVSDIWLQQSLLINNTIEAKSGTTFTITTNDTVQTIPSAQYTDTNGNLAKSMLVSVNGTVSNNRLRFAFNFNPVQGGAGHVLDAIDDTLRIDGIDFIKAFRFINDVNATNFDVTFTMEF